MKGLFFRIRRSAGRVPRVTKRKPGLGPFNNRFYISSFVLKNSWKTFCVNVLIYVIILEFITKPEWKVLL